MALEKVENLSKRNGHLDRLIHEYTGEYRLEVILVPPKPLTGALNLSGWCGCGAVEERV